MNIDKIESQKDLEDIFTAMNRQIYRYVYIRMGYSREIAEDLTQEVFLRVWSKRKEFNSKKSSIRTWIYRIARNLMIDEYRKKKLNGDGNMFEANTAELEEGIFKNEMHRYILTRIKLLSELEQELITLYYIDQLDIKEVAAIIEKNYDATKMAISRAINKLREFCNEGKRINSTTS